MLLIATCHQRKGQQIWNLSLFDKDNPITDTQVQEFFVALFHKKNSKPYIADFKNYFLCYCKLPCCKDYTMYEFNPSILLTTQDT